MEGTRERGERSLLKKLRKTFIWGIGDGWSLCKSMCFPMWFRPFPKKIVRERLTGSSAFYGERVLDIVSYAVVGYRTILVGRERYGSVSLTLHPPYCRPIRGQRKSNERL